MDERRTSVREGEDEFLAGEGVEANGQAAVGTDLHKRPHGIMRWKRLVKTALEKQAALVITQKAFDGEGKTFAAKRHEAILCDSAIQRVAPSVNGHLPLFTKIHIQGLGSKQQHGYQE